MIVDCAVYGDGCRCPGELAITHACEASRRENAFVWIGLNEPTEDEFDAVRREFDLHELAVEDAIKAHQRPKLEVGGGHHRERSLLEPEPIARPVLDAPRSHSAKARLDRLDRVGRREQVRDVVLGQIERHRWILAEARRDAPGMIRTCDLCLRRAALYPLSYGRWGQPV